jgi:DNA-binding MarR family transcriptional regulator
MDTLTPRGRRFSELVAELFRTTTLMLEGAESVAAAVGLTSTKWQILGLVSSAPAPVSHVARAMGRTRQSVQQAADAMRRDGFVDYAPNPHHRRARLMVPTPRALAALARLRPREAAFANQMGRQHSPGALDTALEVLRRTRRALEAGRKRDQR